MEQLKVEFPLRLHFNLLAMHECSYRRNGGIGLSVDAGCYITAEISNRLEFSSVYDIDRRKVNEIVTLLKSTVKKLKLRKYIKLNVNTRLYFHVGLGTGTALTLACLEALLVLNDFPYDDSLLKKLSGRGGTSGIGVNTYFSGGFLCDLGTSKTEVEHSPSHSITPSSIPSILFQCDYPLDKIFFLIPKKAFTTYGQEEINFFKKNTPIPSEDSFYACYNALFMITGSLLDKNYSKYLSAVDKLKYTKWKSLEIENSGAKTKLLLNKLEDEGVQGIGMSSMGPGIYVLSNVKKERLVTLTSEFDVTVLQLRPNNQGRRLSFSV